MPAPKTPGMSLLKEVSFVTHKDPLLDQTGVYANEVTQGSPLDSFKTEAGHTRKTRHLMRRLELLVPSPDHHRGERRAAGAQTPGQ